MTEIHTLTEPLKAKINRLGEILDSFQSVIVAYSGGVDSTFLLRAASEALGERCLAVTARSESLAPNEEEEAVQYAREMGARHRFIRTSELARPEYRANQGDRCYYCKDTLFAELSRIARDEGYDAVLEGTNLSDLSDHRPGRRAGEEHQIRSPLVEAEFTKEDVREVSRFLGLPTWNKPAFACLASRIPVGSEVTGEKLKAVADSEAVLRAIGLRQYRVRHHGEIARIEIPPQVMNTALEHREQIVVAFRASGFKHVCLDLAGFRTGDALELLQVNVNPAQEKAAADETPEEAGEKPGKKTRSENEFKPRSFGEKTLVAYIDGCSKGNPGPAAYGYIIFDGSGRELARNAVAVGHATNNAAEYAGLEDTLKELVKLGAKSVHILMDSLLVVKQIGGEWKIKEPAIREAVARCQAVRRKIPDFHISHIGREENWLADQISGSAIRKKPAKAGS